MTAAVIPELPGLDCGLCGFRRCAELAAALAGRPELLERCIHLQNAGSGRGAAANGGSAGPETTFPGRPIADAERGVHLPLHSRRSEGAGAAPAWHDSLSREFDFFLEHFPEDPGPLEVILPHNPMITR